MKKQSQTSWSFSLLILMTLVSSCGVKAPPTPVLAAPPSRLQQEVERRKAEKNEKHKDKNKKQPTQTENTHP